MAIGGILPFDQERPAIRGRHGCQDKPVTVGLGFTKPDIKHSVVSWCLDYDVIGTQRQAAEINPVLLEETLVELKLIG